MSQTQTAQRPEYPLLNLILSLIAGAAAIWCAQHVGPGAEWLWLGAVFAGLFALKRLHRFGRGMVMHRNMRAVNRAMDRVGTTHGSARWGTWKDAVRAGMSRSSCFTIGRLEGKTAYKNGEGSVVVFAPPGAGKTACLVIPQYLRRHVDKRGRPFSIVGLDFSGEIFAVAAKRLNQLYDVVLIAPWHEEMSEQLGVPMHDAGFNPVLGLLKAGRRTKDMAMQVATLLRPEDPKASGSSKYFQGAAREVLAFGLLYLAFLGDPERMNLVQLRRLLMSSADDLDRVFAEALSTDAFGGTLRELANKLSATRIDSPEEWAGTINTATQAVEIFDGFGVVGKSVSATDGFDFATVKQGKPKAVLISMPAEYAISHGAWLNLVLSVAVEQIGQDGTNKACMLLLDEYCSTGLAMPSVLKSIALYRKQGLNATAIYVQSIGQLERLYGREATRELLGMSELIVGFGVRDIETCKLLSELTGQRTVSEASYNVKSDMFDGRRQQDYSSSEATRGRPLLRPEEVRMLPASTGLVLYGSAPPFKMSLVPYFEDPSLRRHASANPYYRP